MFICRPPSPVMRMVFRRPWAKHAPIAPGSPNPIEEKPLDVNSRWPALVRNVCIVQVKLVPMSVTTTASAPSFSDKRSTKWNEFTLSRLSRYSGRQTGYFSFHWRHRVRHSSTASTRLSPSTLASKDRRNRPASAQIGRSGRSDGFFNSISSISTMIFFAARAKSL